MQLNRFWSAVWSAVLFMISVGMVNAMFHRLTGLVALASTGAAAVLGVAVLTVVPVVAAFLWMDWRWNWKPEHIGLPRQAVGGLWVLAGLAIGVAAAYLMYAVSALLTGGSLVPVVSAPTLEKVVDAIVALLPIVGIEVIFRGAAISRLQADLAPREALLAGPLLPFLWLLVTAFIGRILFLGALETGINPAQPWTFFFVIFLGLLYLRSNSVWLSIGLHMGLMGALTLLNLPVSASGGLLVWVVAALALLAMEWFKLQRMPKRVQPRNTYRGGPIRGPWGPH